MNKEEIYKQLENIDLQGIKIHHSLSNCKLIFAENISHLVYHRDNLTALKFLNACLDEKVRTKVNSSWPAPEKPCIFINGLNEFDFNTLKNKFILFDTAETLNGYSGKAVYYLFIDAKSSIKYIEDQLIKESSLTEININTKKPIEDAIKL